MIIQCEECKSEFNLDESLLKEGGTKVKCTVCQNVFKAYPPKLEVEEEPVADDVMDKALEETVALDAPPDFDEREAEPSDKEVENAFDKAFEDALEEGNIEDVASDKITEPSDEIDKEYAEEPFEDLERDAEAPAAIPPGKRPGRSRTLLVALVIVLVFLITSLAVFFLAPEYLPGPLKPAKKEEITDTGVRRLSFKGVDGTFLQSDKAGQFFVIKGAVINDNPKSRSFILLKGTILDDKGEAIRQKMAYAGNTFTDKQLKKMPFEEISKELKYRFGKDKINFNVKPGGAVPFMIVFENLPENLSEFIVEAVSSSPGN